MEITVCKSVKINNEMESREEKPWTELILVGSDEPFGSEYKFHTFVIVGDKGTFFYRHRECKDDVNEVAA